MPENTPTFSFQCPNPLPGGDTIKMAHGGGGRLMQQLLQNVFFKSFANPDLTTDHDAAVLALPPPGRLAFTTDAFVVHPLSFPGGNIGTLAVNGTVNDLAMSGARPLYLSVSFIIEEGLPISTLQHIAESMQHAARLAEVRIVTGDTKVVDHGKGDGVFITTAGIGVVEHDVPIGPHSIQEGDAILLSGDIGRHGMAVMAVREGLEFESTIESDCAPLAAPVLSLLEGGVTPHMLRDLTRGGLAAALVEIAQSAGRRLHVEQKAIPVSNEVSAACEILGLDPMYVANEGRMILFVPQAQTDQALHLLRQHPTCQEACLIGHVAAPKANGDVILKNQLGIDRILDLLSGEQLPRIC